MPRIRCRYIDCKNLESGFCGADQVDLDPELGCLTYTQEDEDLLKEQVWEEEEDKVLDEEEEEEEEEEWDEDLEDEDLDFDDEDEDDDDDW
jgi:hypothetical protein